MNQMALHLAAAFLAASTLLGAEGKSVVATPTSSSTRPVPQKVTTSPPPSPSVKTTATPSVRWLALSDRPCDSSACRMVRFPWSSVPGS